MGGERAVARASSHLLAAGIRRVTQLATGRQHFVTIVGMAFEMIGGGGSMVIGRQTTVVVMDLAGGVGGFEGATAQIEIAIQGWRRLVHQWLGIVNGMMMGFGALVRTRAARSGVLVYRQTVRYVLEAGRHHGVRVIGTGDYSDDWLGAVRVPATSIATVRPGHGFRWTGMCKVFGGWFAGRVFEYQIVVLY